MERCWLLQLKHRRQRRVVAEVPPPSRPTEAHRNDRDSGWTWGNGSTPPAAQRGQNRRIGRHTGLVEDQGDSFTQGGAAFELRSGET